MKKSTRKRLRKSIRIELTFNYHSPSPEHEVRGEFVKRLNKKNAKKRFHKIKWFSFLNSNPLVTFIKEILKTVF